MQPARQTQLTSEIENCKKIDQTRSTHHTNFDIKIAFNNSNGGERRNELGNSARLSCRWSHQVHNVKALKPEWLRGFPAFPVIIACQMSTVSRDHLKSDVTLRQTALIRAFFLKF